jgi:hypothetical protein
MQCLRSLLSKIMSGKTNRRRGFGFEREIVNDARKRGMNAERAWGSNGKALGCAEEVDCLIEGCLIQAKRRRALPAYLQIPEGCDAVVFRQDRGETLALIPWETLLSVLKSGEIEAKPDENPPVSPVPRHFSSR